MSEEQQSNAARIKELNDMPRYTMWSVFRAQTPLPPLREELAGEVDSLFEQLAARPTTPPTTRGRTEGPCCLPLLRTFMASRA